MNERPGFIHEDLKQVRCKQLSRNESYFAAVQPQGTTSRYQEVKHSLRGRGIYN